MPFTYRQRIYDSGVGGYVYYAKSAVDPAPLAGETTPNHTGALVAATHEIIGSTFTSGGGLRVGAQLWAWNGVDTSQFEATGHNFQRDLGNASPNFDTHASLSVEPWPGTGYARFGNLLRVTAAAGTEGGGVFGILSSEVTLPDRYIIAVRRLEVTGSSGFGVLMANYTPDDGSGQFQGFAAERNSGTSSGTLRVVVNDLAGNGTTLSGAGTISAGLIQSQGGMWQFIEVHRQRAVDNPATSWISCEERGVGAVVYDSDTPGAFSGAQAAWLGLDFTRVGIGWWNSVVSSSGTADFADLKIFAHPDD